MSKSTNDDPENATNEGDGARPDPGGFVEVVDAIICTVLGCGGK